MAQTRYGSDPIQVRHQLLPLPQLLPHQRLRGRRHRLRLDRRYRDGSGSQHQGGSGRCKGVEYPSGLINIKSHYDVINRGKGKSG